MNRLISRMFRDSFGAIVFSAIAGTIGMVVDGIIIGRFLGDGSIAAFGVASPVFLVIFALGGIFSSGMQALCSSHIGEGKMNEANEIFSLSVIITLILSVELFLAIGFFASSIAQFLGASGNGAHLLGESKAYLIGLALGIPAILLQQCMQPVMQLDGDKIKVFIATFVTTFVDVIADLLNVYVGGGMFGMALATSLSYYAGMLVYLLHFRRKNALLRFSAKGIKWNRTRELISTGLPTAISRFSTTIRTFVLNWLLLSIEGAAAVTALSTQTNVNNFFSSVSVGISMSVLMLGGMFYGEKDRNEMKCILGISLKTAASLVSGLGVILFITAPLFASLYISKATESYALCVSSIRFLAISMPLHAVNNVFINYLQGTRNLKLSHLTCLLNELVFLVLCAVVLGSLFAVTGVWLAFPIGKLLTLFTVAVIASIYEKHPAMKLESYLFLPKEFDDGHAIKLELTEDTVNLTAGMTEKVTAFCRENQINETIVKQITHVTELICESIQNESMCGNRKNTVNMRMEIADGEIVIRFRDDCKKYDPRLWNNYSMLNDIAKEVQYNNIMNTNNLMLSIPNMKKGKAITGAESSIIEQPNERSRYHGKFDGRFIR